MYILCVQLCICLACPSKWKIVGFKQFTGSDFMSPKAGNVGVHKYNYFYSSDQANFICFYVLPYFIQHCFICHPSDSTAAEHAEIEPRARTLVLPIRRKQGVY
jgi:hypothetical protein